MTDLRNPFRLRAAEHIESDSDFLRLFGPGVLDLLPDDAPFGRTQFIRSAPGGGKTSLLKLFTPSVLRTLSALGNYGDYKELFQRLKGMGAVDEGDVKVVGIMLGCGRTFPDLADLGLPSPRMRRLLLALLDARILIGVLRSALLVRGLRYPEHLPRLSLEVAGDPVEVPELQVPCDGIAAREWAESLERAICDVIDSFESPDRAGPSGHDALHTLSLLDKAVVMVDGTAIDRHWLLLLDDVHKLTHAQRAALRETLLDQRNPQTTVWVAERLEALSQEELLTQGALEGRDYDGVVNLEEAWRRTPRKFEAAIATIAERRARMATPTAPGEPFRSFTEIIDSRPDAAVRARIIGTALPEVARRVRGLGSDGRFAEWIQAQQTAGGDPEEQIVGWRTLEILIERQQRKPQLAFDFPLSSDELRERDGSDVRAAAELFLAQELALPYYFGPRRLASLGSFNVEQYLRLAGDLFEESAAAALLRQSAALSPERQQAIVAAAYTARLQDLPRRAKNGRDVMNFLQAVGEFCRDVTYQPNAPYAPGVNGVAISMQERASLLSPTELLGNPLLQRFANMLATALSNNLLHAELDKSVKNQRWMILYLNRLICVPYDLPLHFGGFRERRLRDLTSWMDRGHYAAAKSERMI